MSGYTIAILVMFAVTFVDRVHTIFVANKDDGEAAVVQLVLLMCWYAALTMLAYAGGLR